MIRPAKGCEMTLFMIVASYVFGDNFLCTGMTRPIFHTMYWNTLIDLSNLLNPENNTQMNISSELKKKPWKYLPSLIVGSF